DEGWRAAGPRSCTSERPAKHTHRVNKERGGRPMHITCRRRDLYRALRLLSRTIPTRSALPILQNVLIEAPGAGRLRLAATNLEIGIACSIEAVVEQEGSTTVFH